MGGRAGDDEGIKQGVFFPSRIPIAARTPVPLTAGLPFGPEAAESQS